MKRNILLLFTFLAFAGTALAQQVFMLGGDAGSKETIGEANVQITYEFKGINDTLKPDKFSEDLFVLQIAKDGLSKFYSDNLRLRDSIFAAALKNAAGGNFNINFSGKAANAAQKMAFKNYPKGKITVTDKVLNTDYSYEEKMNGLMKWEILADTATILGYLCQKAVTDFHGRRYEAWFTPEIPLQEGPWKFCGLPGLILNIADTKQHFSYRCVEITNVQTPIEFLKREYMKVSGKDLAKIQKKVAEDPTGYIKSSMPDKNIKIEMKDEGGRTLNNMPYNPMEFY
jgi:GLPGLI family protein